MSFHCKNFCWGLLLILSAISFVNGQRWPFGAFLRAEEAPKTSAAVWHDDYVSAWDEAEAANKKLLIFFYEDAESSPSLEWEKTVLRMPELDELLSHYVLTRLPLDTEVLLEADLIRPARPLLTAVERTVTLPFQLLGAGPAFLDRPMIFPAPFSFNFRHPIPVSVKKGIAPSKPTEDKSAAVHSILLKEPQFAEMLGRPGLAIVDLENRSAPYYGKTVSVFPFLDKHPYTYERVRAALTLPSGTLTQRTMIYAVRVHSESPQSTLGLLHPALVAGAESHSLYQAQIRLQGHHHWDQRFAALGRKLSGGLSASEVCAEGWSWQNLLEAAIDCVQCWRQSPGHWSSVSAYQPFYAYDIKKGSNNIWYATGLFGNFYAGPTDQSKIDRQALADDRRQNGWNDRNQIFTAQNESAEEPERQETPQTVTVTVARPITPSIESSASNSGAKNGRGGVLNRSRRR